jgi:hypothetical protein
MKQRSKRASVGTRIIEGVQELVSALDQGEPLTQRFTCRWIELDL